MAYNDLTIRERAAVIKTAVSNGIHRLPEIQAAYNSFDEGGQKTTREEALHNARIGMGSTNYHDAVDFDLNPFNYAARRTGRFLKDLTGNDSIPAGISNCTLTASQWVNPNMPVKSAKTIVSNPNQYGYEMIDAEHAIPGDLLIAKKPNEDSYHTMMINGFKDNQPLLTYSNGTHTSNAVRRNRSLSWYHENDDGHSQDIYLRPKYANEITLPEITVTPKKHSTGGPLYPFSFNKQSLPQVRY